MRAEGVAGLKDILMENKALRRLDLRGNKLGPKGASHVARALTVCKIHRLDLANNGLRTAGLSEVLLALQSNSTLFRLDVKNNVVSAAAGAEQALVTMLQTNKCAVLVDISGTTLEVTPAIEAAM